MGQYFLIVNKSKKEFLDPRQFGEGLKLAEFGSNSDGTMKILAWLLSDNNDHPWSHPMGGRWAGDSIVVSGDYGPRIEEGGVSVYAAARRGDYTDISNQCRGIIDL
jgi:hypothetical protein